MTTMKPVNMNDVDFSKLDFSEVNNLDNGGKICYANYGEDGGSLITSTGMMELPWNMNVYDEADGGKSYALSLSFKGRDTNPATKTFYEGLEALDEHMLQAGVDNQVEWLRKKGKTVDNMKEDYYTPNVRWGKDKETGEISTQYPPRFQMKLVKKNGRWDFPVFSDDRKRVDLDEVKLDDLLVKGAKVKALIKMTTVWTGARGYGCKWKVLQMKVVKGQQFTEYAFDDEDDEDETMELSRTQTTEPTLTTDDNELEDEYLEEEQEVTPPAKTKRSVKRVKKTA
jgi:hypothetical protein